MKKQVTWLVLLPTILAALSHVSAATRNPSIFSAGKLEEQRDIREDVSSSTSEGKRRLQRRNSVSLDSVSPPDVLSDEQLPPSQTVAGSLLELVGQHLIHSRVLQGKGSSDFFELNQVLNHSSLLLTDGMRIPQIGRTPLTCARMSIQDLRADPISTTDTEQTLKITIDDLRFAYCYGKGSGTKFRTDDISVNLEFHLKLHMSETKMRSKMPVKAEITECGGKVTLGYVRLCCGFLNDLKQLFLDIARFFGAGNLDFSRQLCKKLSDTSAWNEQLGEVVGKFEDYTQVAQTSLLALEAQMDEEHRKQERKIKYLNLNDDTSTGRFLRGLISDLAKEWQKEVVPGQVPKQIKASSWIQQALLDGQGKLVIPGDKMLPESLLFSSEDNEVAKLWMYINDIEVIGLDSLSELDEPQIVGKHTIQSHMRWDTIKLIVNTRVVIMPSKRVQGVEIRDDVQFIFGVNTPRSGLALLTYVDEHGLGDIELGALLHHQSRLPCTVEVFHNLQLSAFRVNTSSAIEAPFIEGFVSKGLDRLFNDTTHATMRAYQASMREVLPGFSDTEFRPTINQKISQFLESHVSCQKATTWKNNLDRNSQVDLRDLLLSRTAALENGGTGEEPYGDLIPEIVFPNIQKALGDTKSLSNMILAYTENQSGRAGTMKLVDEPIVNTSNLIPSRLYDSFATKVDELSLLNMDGMTSLMLHDPTNATVVRAQVEFMDSSLRPSLAWNVHTTIGNTDGSLSVLDMNNSIQFQVAANVALDSSIVLDIGAGDLHEMSLESAGNLLCWLGMANPTLESFKLVLSQITVTTRCISCSSPGVSALSAIVESLSGVSVFLEDVTLLTNDVLQNLYDSIDLIQLTSQARAACEKRKTDLYEFLTDEIATMPPISVLSDASIETSVALGFIGIHVALVSGATNFARRPVGAVPLHTDEISREVVQEKSVRLIDFTTLDNYALHGIKWIDEFLGESVPSVVDDTSGTTMRAADNCESLDNCLDRNTTLRANTLLHQYKALEPDGSLLLPLENNSLVLITDVARLREARIYGLDSLVDVHLLNISGSRTFLNRVHWQELRLVMKLEVYRKHPDMEWLPLSLEYKVKDVHGEIETVVEVNRDELGAVKLGTLFFMSNAPFCMSKGISKIVNSRLDIQATNIDDPETTGYFSHGVKDAVDAIVKPFLELHRGVLIEALPLSMNATMKHLINSYTPDVLRNVQSTCEDVEDGQYTGLIDFRDMLLSPEESKKLGGSGKEPYGNTGYTFYKTLNDKVFSKGSSSRPLLVEFLSTLSAKQSNETGTFRLEGIVSNSTSVTYIGNAKVAIGLAISDLTVKNIDSVGDPLFLFRPEAGSANVLTNRISFGVEDRPAELRATITVTVSDGRTLLCMVSLWSNKPLTQPSFFCRRNECEQYYAALAED